MSFIYDTKLRDLLPSSIRDDKTVAASALAVDPTLLASVHAIPNLLLYQRLLLTAELPYSAMLPALARLTVSAGGLAPLSTAELEYLAWQMHVDYRELAKTDKELALMVVNSIAWHRIKGTPASIIQALAAFGLTAKLEEHSCAHWATYQMELDALSIADVMTGYTVAKEMQPARCNLGRIYSPWNDNRIIIHDTQSTWEKFYWDFESGVPVTMPDGTVVIVSLGRNTKMLLEELPFRALIHSHHVHPMCARMRDYWIWDWNKWGDFYPFPARICGENTYPIRLIGGVSLPSYVYRNAQCYIIAGEINVNDTTCIVQHCLHAVRSFGLGTRWLGKWDARTWTNETPVFALGHFVHSALLEQAFFTARVVNSRTQCIAGEVNVNDTTCIVQHRLHSLRSNKLGTRWIGQWDSRTWTNETPVFALGHFVHSALLEQAFFTARVVNSRAQCIAGEVNVNDRTLILQNFVHSARSDSLENDCFGMSVVSQNHSYALEKTSSTAAMAQSQSRSLCARSNNASYTGSQYTKTIVTQKSGRTWTGNWDAQPWQAYRCFITKSYEYQE